MRNINTFRFYEKDSFVHNLWAGTKIISVIFLSTIIGLVVSGSSLVILSLFLILVFLVAQLPLKILPRIPVKFSAFVIASGLITGIFSGEKPTLSFANTKIAIGGVYTFLDFLILTLDAFFMLALVIWTTHTSDFVISISRMMRPLRRLKIPVDEFVSMLSIAVRSLTVIVSELGQLSAAYKLNHDHEPPFSNAKRVKDVFVEANQIMTSFILMITRRGLELGDAIFARGGYSDVVGLEKRMTSKDFLALLVVGMVGGILIFIG